VSNSERRKGAEGEREVAAILRAYGLTAERVPNSGGLTMKGDLTGVLGYHFEVKRQETLRLPLWMRQAEAEAGLDVPVVAYRQSHGRWYAALPLGALAELIERKART
jgi:Holliday junction resolvase